MCDRSGACANRALSIEAGAFSDIQVRREALIQLPLPYLRSSELISRLELPMPEVRQLGRQARDILPMRAMRQLGWETCFQLPVRTVREVGLGAQKPPPNAYGGARR
jgi:hypothetical protein